MSTKTSADVLIGGKIYSLSGYESEEYLHKVASYINGKFSEFDGMEAYKRLSPEMKSTLIQLNIADDYFKAKKQIETLEYNLRVKEQELYDLQHELITSQIKMENCEKNYKTLQAEANESMKKMIRMETELKDIKKS